MIEQRGSSRLAPEVLAACRGVRLSARANCRCWPRAALQEMREALGLAPAALYLPDADGHPCCAATWATWRAEELSFDEEAWRLATGAPIVLRETAGWLVANPFDPPARDWVILPLVTARAS